MATAFALFLLTMIFLHTALWTGYLAANLAGFAKVSLIDFARQVLGSMTFSDHVLLVLKPVFTGYAIAYISIRLVTSAFSAR